MVVKESPSDKASGWGRVLPSVIGIGAGTVLDVFFDFRFWQRILIYAGFGIVAFLVYELLKRILTGRSDDRSE
jgi:hypothetical protein